ncbi:MAG: hypothetical protein JJU37_06130 [Balneolaceae bacterium]|nr:hypothetical protein [Balneolaceae bacterium]
MIKIYSYLAIITTVLIFTSCSDSSSGPGDLGLDEGKGAVTVTGAINAEYEGEAWYVIDRGESSTVFQIFVSDVEFSIDPNANDEISFVLQFRQDSGSESFSISTGNFDVGENATFFGIFADVSILEERGDGYETLGNTGGSINITSQSSGLVDAEFEFTATNPENGGNVNVSGALRATCLGAGFGNPNC